MLGIGEQFPLYSLVANVSANRNFAFKTISDQDYPDQWKVYFFWPKDFTPLSRTEIISFGSLWTEFRKHQTQVLGGSVESELAHLAWRDQDQALRDSPIPFLADTNRNLCGQLGILDEVEGVPQRATFIVDRSSTIRFVYATEPNIARNPVEVLRVLSHLVFATLERAG